VELVVVEVLILNGFKKGCFYKVVILVGRKTLRKFEGQRGRDV
jgi:hypothetical protein